MNYNKFSAIILLTIFISSTLPVFATKTPLKAYAQSSGFVCPSKNVQHWDKIVFFIRSPDLSKRVRLPMNTELDIKVLDDPLKVADLKQKVLSFLKVPTEPRTSIQILDVRYAIICAT